MAVGIYIYTYVLAIKEKVDSKESIMSKDNKESMNYMRPEMVRSPKNMLSGLNVLLDKGEGEWSLAEVIWEKKERLAVRWNGSFDEKNHGVGTPQSRGLPMWFILPDDDEFFKTIDKYKKTKK
jgi:hypothetical protein